jgi:hypothetical protein
MMWNDGYLINSMRFYISIKWSSRRFKGVDRVGGEKCEEED